MFWEGYVSDVLMGTIAPIALYWIYGGSYMLMPPLKRYRLHTKREEDEINIVDLPTVVRGVLFQHILQAIIVFFVSVIFVSSFVLLLSIFQFLWSTAANISYFCVSL
jgi:sphinganine C4-monooxygenase